MGDIKELRRSSILDHGFSSSSSSSASSTSTSNSRVIALLLLLVAIGFPGANSLSLSGTGDSEGLSISTGRTLLQAQQGCLVSFENINYTVITSRCKGPKYPPKICCEAFKDLACPYADQLNDQSNNCANTMFSYIDLYGKYPPGLFANECRDSKRGLECSDAQSSPAAPTPSAAPPPPFQSLLLLSFLPALQSLLL